MNAPMVSVLTVSAYNHVATSCNHGDNHGEVTGGGARGREGKDGTRHADLANGL